MATKRLRFLKRVKIQQQDVRIRLEVNGSVKRFKTSLSLEAYRFPPEARIFVDAKQLLETVRFASGTVGNPAGPVLHDVSRLRGERITFNVLVLDSVSARKLGAVTAIRPNVDSNNTSDAIPLLPVDASSRVAPLIWEIEYSDHDQEGHTDAPVLKVDSEAARHSAAFFMQDTGVRAMVLPAAMREVLTKVLLVDGDEYEYEPHSRSWRNSWIRFASRLVGEDPPRSGEPNAQEDVSVWISRATRALAANGEFLAAYMRERAV